MMRCTKPLFALCAVVGLALVGDPTGRRGLAAQAQPPTAAAPSATTSSAATGAASTGKKKIVFLAGPKDHGPLNNGRHEYEKDLRALARYLEDSPNLKGLVETKVFVGKAPRDLAEFQDAAAIIIESSSDRDARETHPLFPPEPTTDRRTYDPETLAYLKALDGVIKSQQIGVAVFHYANWAENWTARRYYLGWLGGLWVQGGSTNPVAQWAMTPKNESHPVLRGVKPWTYRDEVFCRFFLPNDARRTELLIGTPSKAPNGPDVSALGPQVAAWAYDRADGGRGFVMGGVDFHDNLRTVEDYRRFLLNGIAWVAKIEVPESGVQSVAPPEAPAAAGANARAVATGQAATGQVATAPAAAPASSDRHTTWNDYGGGPDSSKFVAFDQITKANVQRLQVAWTYPTGDNAVYGFNPIIVDDVMYVLARNSSLVALNATTGQEIWIHENLRGIARRGVNYWESKDRSDRRILFQMNNHLQAIDARTGKSILGFGKNGLVDLREGLGRDAANVARAQSNTPGKIFENSILLGVAPGEAYMSTPGYLRAYDVVTGALMWTFHTVPLPGEYGYETWPKDAYKYAGGANTWGEISVDAQRGIAYFPTGSPTYDYYGADRLGQNLFGNCLLALDARTGKRLWHFQVVHHDLWDYDLTAAPQLITVTHKGRRVDAVAQASKHGFLFVFDRVTGEPLWPIEERPVPKSDMPGEQAWPTQPFPTVVPPFNRQTVTVKDLTPYLLSPQEREAFTTRIANARTGLFTPLSTQETITMPGAVGGANLGNTAAHPSAGIVYVMSQDFPSFYQLSETPPNITLSAAQRAAMAAAGGSGAGGGAGGSPGSSPGSRGPALFAQTCQACHAASTANANANAAAAGAPAAAGPPGAAAAAPTVGPSLASLGARMAYEDFRQIVTVGRGHMPAFPSIDDEAMRALYVHLSGGPGGSAGGPMGDPREGPGGSRTAARPTGGPVVASGGAPGGVELRRGAGFRPGAVTPYPEGVEAPATRYYTGYGLSFPFILGPPWSTLTAYDLNAGTVKWRTPLGEDRDAVTEGATGTGMPRGSQRMGMVVTSTGLVFATARDGKVRAYDAETGAAIWTGDLPHGAEGIPSMYQLNGRQYLVVSATTSLVWGRKALGGSDPWVKQDANTPGGGYVVFALPEGRPF